MIQIHSTWFPYIDRNPQKYVENIYKADAGDFIKSEIRIYGSSVVEIGGGEKLNTKIEGVKKWLLFIPVYEIPEKEKYV